MRNLNKPPRYNVASIQAQQTLGGDVMQSDENGQYVEWRDYKWLLDSYAFVRDQWKDLDSENARLKAEVERLTIEADWKTPARKIRALEAEVERLRKAGDNLARIVSPSYPVLDDDDAAMWADELDAISKWNAAKEGKQS